MLISIAAAVLFIANIFREGWVFPIIAVGLWGFISIVVGTIYPAVIQRFVVQPNEFARGADVHRAQHRGDARRVRARRQTSTTQDFDYSDRPRPRPTSRRNEATLDNVRLWDPAPLQEVFRVDAGDRCPFYRFADVDVDRYDVDGDEHADAHRRARARLRRSSRATRGRTGTSCTRTATASVAAAANRTTTATSRATSLSDIPPHGRARAGTRPAGRLLRRGPVAATRSSTRRSPSRKPTASGDRRRRRSTRATAASRCRASCARAALALRFGDWNLFVSGQVTTTRASSTCATSSERVADRGAVPAVRRRPVPGRARRHGSCGCSTRYTTTEPLPVLAVDQPEQPARRQRPRHRLQLRAQLGEGDRRRVRRHDQLLRRRPDGPDHPDVPQGVPRAVQRRRTRCPTGCASTGATPKTCSDAQTEQYTLYHMTDPTQFFQQAVHLGHRAEPGHERRHGGDDRDDRPTATTAGATRRSRRRATPDRSAAT